MWPTPIAYLNTVCHLQSISSSNLGSEDEMVIIDANEFECWQSVNKNDHKE